MKNLILTLITLLCVQTSFSQVKNIEYSTPFEEPEKGWYKILQLSNGNTFYFNINGDNGVEITVYKPDRKIGAKRVLSNMVFEPKRMRACTMKGVYEIGGQPVLFIQQLLDWKPQLFRIVLNPENGAQIKQEKIGELTKYKLSAGYAMAFGGVDAADFIIEKDPYSDAYAIVNYNSFSKESDKRIEVVHYNVENGEHVEINRLYYDAQNFKYTTFIGMIVNSDKSIHLATYGFNTKSSGGKDSRVIISRIRRGEKAFTNVNMEFTDDFKDTEGLMNFNPETGMIQLMTFTLLNEKRHVIHYYKALMNYIDPESLQIIKSIELPTTALMAYYKSKKMGNDEFRGMPVNMILNNDNTSTILVEEKRESEINSTLTEIAFGRIGVITLDNAGKDIESYGIMKGQKATGAPMDNMYLAKRNKGIWAYRRSMDTRPFYSFDYVNTKNNNTYIIFNDNPDNYKNGKELTDYDKTEMIKGVSESVTTFRMINNKGMESGLFFGRNANDNQTSFCNVESSHFRKETGVYAVLMVKRIKREKKAYISWVTLE